MQVARQQQQQQERQQQQGCSTSGAHVAVEEDDEAALLLDLDGGFDLSALQWFGRTASLPDGARVVVQHPGEVLFVPAGWWHVVLNVKTSTAVSHALTLGRDLPRLLLERAELGAGTSAATETSGGSGVGGGGAVEAAKFKLLHEYL